VGNRVEALEAVAYAGEWVNEILLPARTPINRIRLDHEPGAPECPDRPRHVISRGHQQPALAGVRVSDCLASASIFVRIARAIFQQQSRLRNAQPLEQASCLDGFGVPV
jgi:hypothetical protein